MRKAKLVGLCVLGLCTLLLWDSLAGHQRQTLWFDDCVSVCWRDGTGVSPRDLSRALEWQREDGGTPPPLALWRVQSDQMLYGDLHPAPATGEVLEYYGEVACLLPRQFRSGYWPGDRQGCVIDVEAAYILWGSCDGVLGRPLQWNGNTWYVRGILEGMDGLAVFPADETSETAFSGLWLDLSATEGGSIAAEQILRAYQMPIGDITDLGMFAWIAKMMAALPASLLWGWLMLRIASRLWRLRHTRMLLLFSVPPLALTAAAASWAAGFPWTIPERFLPTRWSDGSFWSELAGSILDGILSVFQMPPAIWETLFWNDFFCCAMLCIPAALMVFFTVRALIPATPKIIFWFSLIWWTGLLGAAWRNRGSLYGSPSFTLWVLLSMWMVLNWLMDLFDEWLAPGKYERRRIDGPLETKTR